MPISLSFFERAIIRELRNNNLCIFGGAGLSRGSGFVDWKGLLKDVASELNLDINKEHDLVTVAQYHCNENGREFINEVIVQEFQRSANKNENMNILSRLPITSYWTTNYDSIIEDTLNDIGKVVDVKIDQGQLKYYTPNRNVVVYKMHGDKDYPNKTVITRDDYENYEEERGIFTTHLKGELVAKTFLFIGFSFDDPNLEQILSKVRVELLRHGENPKTHYCFFKKVNITDKKYQNTDGTINNSEYEYDKVKQDLKIKDLKKYGIRAVLIDDYPDITKILGNIERKYMLNNIFISGSAHKYGDFADEEAKILLHKLSNSLVKDNYHIISGFGLGVGNFIINGVLEEVFQKNKYRINDKLTIRPFPQIPSGNKSLEELWTEYRQEMISESGMVIFVFGNKRDENGDIVNADGVLEEYQIAKDTGKYIIPIGSTGYVTREIFNEVRKEVDDFWYLKDSLSVLENEQDTEKIIKEIFTIIQRIKEGV